MTALVIALLSCALIVSVGLNGYLAGSVRTSLFRKRPPALAKQRMRFNMPMISNEDLPDPAVGMVLSSIGAEAVEGVLPMPHGMGGE